MSAAHAVDGRQSRSPDAMEGRAARYLPIAGVLSEQEPTTASPMGQPTMPMSVELQLREHLRGERLQGGREVYADFLAPIRRGAVCLNYPRRDLVRNIGVRPRGGNLPSALAVA
jgi:hypothetical protein